MDRSSRFEVASELLNLAMTEELNMGGISLENTKN